MKKTWIKLAINMIRIIEVLKIYLKEQFSEKVLRDKAFNNAKNLRYDVYQQDLLQWLIKLLNVLIRSPLRLQINLNLVVVLKVKLC